MYVNELQQLQLKQMQQSLTQYQQFQQLRLLKLQHQMFMMNPQQTNFNQTKNNKICIYDWDDTLFPTTDIIRQKKDCTVNKLYNFGKIVFDLLNEYINKFGNKNLFIVTNGSEGWVKYSLRYLNKIYKQKMLQLQPQPPATTYFELILNLLIKKQICVISAKHLYGKQYPNATTLWKTLVFKQIVIERFQLNNLNNMNTNQKYSIISIGDSMDEFQASVDTKRMLNEICSNNTVLHRIKLQRKPTINQMINQMQTIISLSNVLYQETNEQTIDFEKTF